MSQGQRPLKITLVGAGSVVFTRKLLGDILSRPKLAGCHIALHDIDEHRWALDAAAQMVKTVGLCHSVQNTAEELAHDLGLPVGEIDCHCASIKHRAFFLQFDHRGESLIPRLRQLMDEYPGRCPLFDLVWPCVERELKQPGSQDPQALQRDVAAPGIRVMPFMVEDAPAMLTGLRTVQRSVEYGSAIIHAMVDELLAAHRLWLPDWLQETTHA